MTVLVVAATHDIYRDFACNVKLSGEEVKLRRLTSIDQIRGTIPEKVVVLPGGWHSILQGDKNLITAFCARNQISIYNVTQSKLDTLAKLVEQEKAKDAEAKAYSESR